MERAQVAVAILAMIFMNTEQGIRGMLISWSIANAALLLVQTCLTDIFVYLCKRSPIQHVQNSVSDAMTLESMQEVHV